MKKSLGKIFYQLRLRRRMKKVRSKCNRCSDTVFAFCKNNPRYCRGPYDW